VVYVEEPEPYYVSRPPPGRPTRRPARAALRLIEGYWHWALDWSWVSGHWERERRPHLRAAALRGRDGRDIYIGGFGRRGARQAHERRERRTTGATTGARSARAQGGPQGGPRGAQDVRKDIGRTARTPRSEDERKDAGGARTAQGRRERKDERKDVREDRKDVREERKEDKKDAKEERKEVKEERKEDKAR
jgi:hypothetical protein